MKNLVKGVCSLETIVRLSELGRIETITSEREVKAKDTLGNF